MNNSVSQPVLKNAFKTFWIARSHIVQADGLVAIDCQPDATWIQSLPRNRTMTETVTRHHLVDTRGRVHGNADWKNSALLMMNFVMHSHIACKMLIQLRTAIFPRIRTSNDVVWKRRCEIRSLMGRRSLIFAYFENAMR